MPELPEVETIIRLLRTPAEPMAGVVGKIISRAEVNWAKSVAVPGVDEFLREIKGRQIREINRRGKFICMTLSGSYLLVHLRMSGDLFLEAGKTDRNSKHDRVVVHFSDDSRLVFNDTRKFGRVWLLDDPMTVTGALGLEPLEDSLTADVFYEMLQVKKRQIKPLLLDQSFIAGLGNIYTDEALFTASIHPLSRADVLTRAQAGDLLTAIRQVLQEGIKRNGASIDWVYRGGDFQNHFQVYQRDGKPCQRCGTAIQRITVGQRGTHFCPHCQVRVP